MRSRWAGKSHHRLYQLQKERKTHFTIYYEILPKSQLDAIEPQRIEQYNPQLNGTKVNKKKLRPTETLLRETLVILAPLFNHATNTPPATAVPPRHRGDYRGVGYGATSWRIGISDQCSDKMFAYTILTEISR